MRPVFHRLAMVMLTGLLAGCSADRPMTPTQMDALQVREVEAPADRAFAAASGALVDAGYRLVLSDGDTGILTAEYREDPAVAANVAVITLTTAACLLSGGHVAPTDLPPTYHAVCLQVMPVAPARSAVRIRCYQDAAAKHNAKRVEELWALMQRQVLMKEPARPG